MKPRAGQDLGGAGRGENYLTFARARELLAWTWCASLPLILIVLIQTALGYYSDKWQIPWGWLLPLLFPILSLIYSAITATAKDAHKAKVHSTHLFRITVVLSILYIMTLYIVVIFGAISPLGIDWLMNASIWFLIPFQMIVSITLSKFFIEEVH